MKWTRPATRPDGTLPLLAILAILAAAAAPPHVSAQDTRVVIVIPDLVPADGANDRFGRQVAEELRERIESPEHRAYSTRELRETLRRYDVAEKDFNCLLAYQLATREQLQLAFCGNYRELAGGRYAFFDVAFTAAVGGARFRVPDFQAANREEAAEHIVGAFRDYARQLGLLRNCSDYVGAESWTEALTNCERALEINPDYLPALELKGNVLREMGRMEEALAVFERVVGANPLSAPNLYNAGYIATQLERRPEARAFFERYLELKPGDAAVRLTIAHELATGGDNLGALQLAEAGLREFAADTAALALSEYAGHYAKNAANAIRDGQVDAPAGMSAAVLYARALELYTTVYEARGDAVSADLLRNMVLMHREVGQLPEAIAMAERALATHGEDAGLWWAYATVLTDAERHADARHATERVAELDPDFPSVWARLATITVNAGELEDAVRTVGRAVDAGGPGDQFASLMIANAGYTLYAQKDNHRQALRWYAAARPFAATEKTRHMADFFEGYSRLVLARTAQEPRTCASARATLPDIRRAQALVQGATAYDTRSKADVVGLAQQLVDIQEALLKQPRCR